MPKSHEDLICWQLADQLRQMIIEQTKEGAAAKDLRLSLLRHRSCGAWRNKRRHPGWPPARLLHRGRRRADVPAMWSSD